MTLDITAPRTDIQRFETIDLTGTGDNTLVVDKLSVLGLSEDTSGGITTLTVNGNNGDTVQFDDEGWTSTETTTLDGVVHNIYRNGNAEVLIPEHVTVELPSAAVQTFAATSETVSLSTVNLGDDGIGPLSRDDLFFDETAFEGLQSHVIAKLDGETLSQILVEQPLEAGSSPFETVNAPEVLDIADIWDVDSLAAVKLHFDTADPFDAGS